LLNYFSSLGCQFFSGHLRRRRREWTLRTVCSMRWRRAARGEQRLMTIMTMIMMISRMKTCSRAARGEQRLITTNMTMNLMILRMKTSEHKNPSLWITKWRSLFKRYYFCSFVYTLLDCVIVLKFSQLIICYTSYVMFWLVPCGLAPYLTEAIISIFEAWVILLCWHFFLIQYWDHSLVFSSISYVLIYYSLTTTFSG